MVKHNAQVWDYRIQMGLFQTHVLKLKCELNSSKSNPQVSIDMMMIRCDRSLFLESISRKKEIYIM